MKINPRQLEKMAKKMGIQTEEIPADEVIIKQGEKELVVSNPQVSKVNMMGQETLQITGEISERSTEKITSDDVKIVMEQTGCTEEQAESVLKETGDIAQAILKLKK